MAKSLGIFVTNPDNLHHVIGVTKAAKAKGSQVKVFFTWTATHNSKDKDFPPIKEGVSFPPIKTGARTIESLSISLCLKKIEFKVAPV